MRNYKVFLGAALITGMLTGCGGGDSDVIPEDNPSGAIPLNTSENEYNGRAADGYLRDAFVWLDIDDDKLWDEGEEPSAYTTEGGNFKFDLTAFNEARRMNNERILDARDYPMVLLAIPGRTIDEGDGSESIPVDKAFFLLAPPDTNFISPLSTLVKTRLDLGIIVPPSEDEAVYATNVAHNSVSDILGLNANYLQNYVIADDAQMQLYASAVVSLLKSHTTDEIDQKARNLELAYTEDEINVIGRNVLNLMPLVVENIEGQVEQGIGYDQINVGELDLPLSPIDLADPFVLLKETTRKNASLVDGEEPKKNASSDSTIAHHKYSTDGILDRIEVDGYRLMTADGVLTETRQFWSADGNIEQIFNYQWEDGRLSQIALDSIHHLDNNPALSKSQAAFETIDKPDAYSFDGVFEATSEGKYEADRVTEVVLEDESGSYLLVFSFDEQDRVSRKDYYRVVGDQNEPVSYSTYEYGEEDEQGNWTLVREVNRETSVNIAQKTTTLIFVDGQEALAYEQELVLKKIDVNGVMTEVPDYIFEIDHLTEYSNYRYTRINYTYKTAIDILQEDGGDFIGLDPASSDDLATARSRVENVKLLEQEGFLTSWELVEARNNSQPNIGLPFLTNQYEYGILSEYILSELIN